MHYMSRRPPQELSNAHRGRQARWETRALVLVVLVVWATVALDCMSGPGFTTTAKIREDRSWTLKPDVAGCQPDAHGASFMGTITNHGRDRHFAVDVRFHDGAGRLVDSATTHVRAGMHESVSWIVHAAADPEVVRSCSASASRVARPN